MTRARALEIVRPGQSTYESVRHVYSSTGSPAAVLLPTSAAEVAEALVFARSQPGPLSIRSGGHGISSISTNDGGTVIDLRRLGAVDHLGGAAVRVGPGARWGGVARALYPWGLALTSGDSGDVGVGGLATTGGLGLLGRSQGLTIDRMRAAELVTADGRMLRLSADEHPELFWAVRGAGANVGIVTAFEFEAGTTPVVARASVMYDVAVPGPFLEQWGATVEAAPREIAAFLYVGGGTRPFAQATIVYAGDEAAAAARAIEPFVGLPGVAGQRAELVPYPAVPLTSGAPHTGQQAAVMHGGLVGHIDQDLAERLEVLLRSPGVDMVQIRSAGGAINDVPTDATAYAHRHQNFSVTAVAGGPSPSFDDVWAPVRQRMDGMYLSFESRHRPADVGVAFPPRTLERLRRIKADWDPDDVFSQNFDVEAAASDDREQGGGLVSKHDVSVTG